MFIAFFIWLLRNWSRGLDGRQRKELFTSLSFQGAEINYPPGTQQQSESILPALWGKISLVREMLPVLENSLLILLKLATVGQALRLRGELGQDLK